MDCEDRVALVFKIVTWKKMHRYVSDDSSSDDDTSLWSTSSDNNTTSSCDEEVLQPESKKQKRSDNSDKEPKLSSEMEYDVVLRVNYKWVIKDYTKVTASLKCSQKLESPVFAVGHNNEYEFQLVLYPRGVTDAYKNYLSLYLVLKSSDEPEMKLRMKCYICNSKGIEKYNNVEENVTLGCRVGFRRLARTETITYKNSDYLENDRLVLNCDIYAMVSKLDKSKMKVINDLEMLLDTGAYSDVVLEVQDKKFQVHKYILAARSQVFAAMFTHDMKEKNENIVKITDFDKEIMEKLLRFTYSGQVKNLDNSAKELLAAADKYDFADLKMLCEKSLYKSLKVDNVMEIFTFAELHNSGKLKEQALNFFVKNVKAVVKTEAYKLMAEQSPLFGQVINELAKQQN